MSVFAEILVHLDHDARVNDRIEFAAKIAKQHEAHLTGLYVDTSRRSFFNKPKENGLEEVSAFFEKALKENDVEGRVCTAPKGDRHPERYLIQAARCSDLTIVGQHDDANPDAGVPAEIAETVALQSGRPLLVMPYTGAFKAEGKRVLIAWNGGREATRAVQDALPILRKAAHVDVLNVHHKGEDKEPEQTDFALVPYLGRHGIDAKLHHAYAGDVGAMDLILSFAADESSDLLVMGAHGHYGFPYLHRGGSTKHILNHMTLPVILSH